MLRIPQNYISTWSYMVDSSTTNRHVFLPEMQAHALAAEAADLLHDAFHVDVIALTRLPRAVRHDDDVARSIINAIELHRHERH